MIYRQLWTQDYEHKYFFKFKDKDYRVHTVVKLTDSGRRHLKANKNQVILTEYFIDWTGQDCWSYVVGYSDSIRMSMKVSTNTPPDELIEEIVLEPSADYVSRELFGQESPVYKTGTKHTRKDWEIPEVRRGWIVFALVCIGSFILKDWYLRVIISGVAGWVFGQYRKAYIDAYTTYTHDEDTEMLKKKYEVLYGIKFNKGDNNNE